MINEEQKNNEYIHDIAINKAKYWMLFLRQYQIDFEQHLKIKNKIIILQIQYTSSHRTQNYIICYIMMPYVTPKLFTFESNVAKKMSSHVHEGAVANISW